TIEDFQYRESITFSAAPGKPFLKYEQHTTSPDGAAMHTEVGYLRPHEGGFIEFVLAQPTGQTELLEGTATVNDDNSLTMVLGDRKSTRLNSSHVSISYAVFCLR